MDGYDEGVASGGYKKSLMRELYGKMKYVWFLMRECDHGKHGKG